MHDTAIFWTYIFDLSKKGFFFPLEGKVLLSPFFLRSQPQIIGVYIMNCFKIFVNTLHVNFSAINIDFVDRYATL